MSPSIYTFSKLPHSSVLASFSTGSCIFGAMLICGQALESFGGGIESGITDTSTYSSLLEVLFSWRD